ncbi:MAG: hypothetical protein U0163_13855 [Gemmatimonadaceae bacterium]
MQLAQLLGQFLGHDAQPGPGNDAAAEIMCNALSDGRGAAKANMR